MLLTFFNCSPSMACSFPTRLSRRCRRSTFHHICAKIARDEPPLFSLRRNGVVSGDESQSNDNPSFGWEGYAPVGVGRASDL